MFLNEARFGEISIISSSEDCSEYSRNCCIPYLDIFGCRPRGHEAAAIFDLQSLYDVVFPSLKFFLWEVQNLSVDYYLGKDLHLLFAFKNIFGGECSFSLRVLYRFVFWNFIQLESSEVPRLGRLKLVAVKKYLSTAWTILSNCQLVA